MPSPLSADAHVKTSPALLVISALYQKAVIVIYVLIKEIIALQVWKGVWGPHGQRTGGTTGGNGRLVHILTEVITEWKLKGKILWLLRGWNGAGMLRDLFHSESPNTGSAAVSTC